MTIWKFELAITDTQYITMPEGARLLTVQVQSGQPCIWALVQPGGQTVRRKIWIVGTGHEHESFPAEYVGTFQSRLLVLHVFDLGEFPAEGRSVT